MQKDQDILDLYGKCSWDFENGTVCEKDEIHLSNGGTNETLKILNDAKNNLYDYLPFQSLTTISKHFIWLGFVTDNVVCLTEFIVIWLKVQATPCYFVFISLARYLTYIMSTIFWHDLEDWGLITTNLSILIVYRILLASHMCCVTKELCNEVDGILSNPVIHAIGPTGKKAMAGA